MNITNTSSLNMFYYAVNSLICLKNFVHLVLTDGWGCQASNQLAKGIYIVHCTLS